MFHRLLTGSSDNPKLFLLTEISLETWEAVHTPPLCKIAPQIRSSAKLMGLTTLSSAKVALRHHTVKARPGSLAGALTLAHPHGFWWPKPKQ